MRKRFARKDPIIIQLYQGMGNTYLANMLAFRPTLLVQRESAHLAPQHKTLNNAGIMIIVIQNMFIIINVKILAMDI